MPSLVSSSRNFRTLIWNTRATRSGRSRSDDSRGWRGRSADSQLASFQVDRSRHRPLYEDIVIWRNQNASLAMFFALECPWCNFTGVRQTSNLIWWYGADRAIYDLSLVDVLHGIRQVSGLEIPVTPPDKALEFICCQIKDSLFVGCISDHSYTWRSGLERHHKDVGMSCDGLLPITC